MVLYSARSCSGMWLKTSFELLAHLVRLNSPRSIILCNDCCNSTVTPALSIPVMQSSTCMFDRTSLDASGNSSLHFLAWLWTVPIQILGGLSLFRSLHRYRRASWSLSSTLVYIYTYHLATSITDIFASSKLKTKALLLGNIKIKIQ